MATVITTAARTPKFERGHEQAQPLPSAHTVWLGGGGDLAGQFYDAGLLDEVFVQVGSVTLGKGKPLFPRRAISTPWKLRSVRQVGSGFAELHYDVVR